MEVELGDKVKCKHSGFVGIAVSRTEFINGCIQYEVIPKVKKNNELVEGAAIDSQSLQVVTKAKKKVEVEEETNGGPMRSPFKQRGY